MSEGRAAVDIAKRVHSTRSCFQPIINFDHAAFVCFDSGSRKIQ